MKKKWIILLILLIIPMINFNVNHAQATAGDSRSTAINLPLNTIINTTFSPPHNIWYNSTITTGGDYSFNLSIYGQGIILNLYLYNNLGTEIANTISDSYPKCIIKYLDPGTYSIEVFVSLGTGSFSIAADYARPGQTFDNPFVLPFNTTIQSQPNYDLFYQISIPSSNYYKINLSSDSFYVNSFELLDNHGNFLDSPNDAFYPQILIPYLPTGFYYIHLLILSIDSLFNISVFPYSPHSGEVISKAIQLQVNTTSIGTMSITDFYNLSISTQGYYNSIITGNTNSLISLTISDSRGYVIANNKSSGFTITLASYFSVGNYTIEIHFSSQSGSFNISYTNYNAHLGEFLSNAIFLPVNTNIEGTTKISFFYNFTITIYGAYKFVLSNDLSFSANFRIYDNSYQNLIVSSHGTNPSFSGTYLKPGNYFIYILPVYGSGTFYLSYSSYTPQSGELLQSAINLPKDSCVVGRSTYQMYYNFTIESSEEYFFRINGATNSYFSFIISNNSGSYVPSGVDSIYTQLQAGNYSMAIYGTEGSNFAVSYQYASNISLSCSLILLSNSTSDYSTSTNSTTEKSHFFSIPFSSIDMTIAFLVIIAIFRILRKKQGY